MIRKEIENLIENSIKNLQKEEIFPKFEMPEISIEKPEKKTHGDYATNVAMVIAKQVKKNPLEIAEDIKSKVLNLKSGLFDKIEVAKPGFINFFISKEYLQKQVGEILRQGEKFGRLNLGKNKKTNVEFISANPTGPLHIGNGRGAFFGDTLANILKNAGYEVIKEYYINDTQISNQIQELGKTALEKGESYLTPYLKQLILRLKPSLKKFKSETDAGHFLAKNILGDIRKFVKEKLKIKFDFWISEQNLYRQDRVKEIYEFLKGKNLVYEKDGAFWLNLSKFNQKDEVLIRENGQPTYFLADIAYHKYKIERTFQKIINIWGADHQGHVPRIKAVMKILGYKGEFDVSITQIVRLKRLLPPHRPPTFGGPLGKMSKRKGEIVTLEWLIDEVGLDAARFFYLMKSLDTQMEFDLELAKEQSEKNPVFYIQYAHARICSILKRIKNLEFRIKNLGLLNHPSELQLIKQLIRFPEIIEDTAKDYQVQRIPQYAIDLATVFHQFYRDCRVISETEGVNKSRLNLISATKIVLKNSLSLMGISAPEKM